MEKVYVILWLGKPVCFNDYRSAKRWLKSKYVLISDYEVNMSIYVCEVKKYD